MRDLRVADLRALNQSVLLLNGDGDEAGFSQQLALALETLIPSELAAVETFDRTGAWKDRLLGDPDGVISKHFDAFLRLEERTPSSPPSSMGNWAARAFAYLMSLSEADYESLRSMTSS